MRYILIGTLFLGTGCSGQQNTKQQVSIDTVKLFDPKPNPTDYGSPEMFKNCLLLTHQQFGLVIHGKQFKFNSEKDLQNKIQIEKKEIIKSRFYVFIDSSVSFAKIISNLDYLKKSSVDNYRVINFDSYFKPSEPITIEQPTITTKTIDAIDSSYFSITILNDSFEINFLNKKRVLKSSSEVDRFIQDKKTLINPNKILIIGNSKASYKKIDPILEILKKHQYHKFQMLTK